MTYAIKNISYTDVQKMIARYHTEEIHPDVSHFTISDLFRMEDGSPDCQNRAGVYAIYRADKTLIYFGMSLSNISARISKHRSERVQASIFWKTHTAELAQTILVS